MPGREQLDAHNESLLEAFSLRDVRPATAFWLTVSFMLLVIFMFVSVESWRAWRDYRHAYDAAGDAVSNLARATAQHAEDAIRQVDVLTDALAERVEGDGIQKIDVPRIHRLLVQQGKIMPQLHGLFIYGPDGQWIVTDKKKVPDQVNNADRDYFQYHRNNTDRNVRIGTVVRSRSTDELIIPVSRRLNNPDGSFAGVLLGTISLSYFVNYYGDFKIDGMGALVLAKRDGTILVRRPFVADVIGKSLAASEIFRLHLPYSDSGVVEVKAIIDDTDRLYGYRALSTYPLVVEAGLSREAIIAPWRRDLIKTGIVLVILAIVLGGFGLVVLSQLRQRLATEKQLRQAHKAMRDMALTDSLTGLNNRRHLDAALLIATRQARRQGSCLTVVMLDVDYFKLFNDRYGHAAGDECLRQVAGAIKGSVKRPGDVAVRYGGEEFTVVLPDTDESGGVQVAESILAAIRNLEIAHSEHPLGKVTASAGVATTQPGTGGIAPDELIKAADALLYSAKQQGRNRVCAASL
jgi:diguanylate cyclase